MFKHLLTQKVEKIKQKKNVSFIHLKVEKLDQVKCFNFNATPLDIKKICQNVLLFIFPSFPRFQFVSF